MLVVTGLFYFELIFGLVFVFLSFFCFSKIGFLKVDPVLLGLALSTRLALNSEISLPLPSAAMIKDLGHHHPTDVTIFYGMMERILGNGTEHYTEKKRNTHIHDKL